MSRVTAIADPLYHPENTTRIADAVVADSQPGVPLCAVLIEIRTSCRARTDRDPPALSDLRGSDCRWPREPSSTQPCRPLYRLRPLRAAWRCRPWALRAGPSWP